MSSSDEVIRVKDREIEVSSIEIDKKDLVVTGKILRIAKIKEEWYEDVEDPALLIEYLKKTRLNADIFTFWQRLPDTKRKYNYYMEWDYIAALTIKDFNHWWEKQIRSRTRGLIRKAERKGVIVREADFNDEFVHGMTHIFNETPIRQGKTFWHYRKDFETVKREFSGYLFREDILGAYYENELIGFIFLAYAGKYAITGQIISMIKHRDKAPNNALIAKAVEICDRKKIPYLVYLNWGDGTLAEFKRRNGFEKTALPRYFIPLTIKGKIALILHLHHSLVDILPKKWKYFLLRLRKRIYA